MYCCNVFNESEVDEVQSSNEIEGFEVVNLTKENRSASK